MVQIREFQRITQEEDRGVIADQIPVTFLGVELHCKTANITLSVSGAALTGDGGEACEQLGFFADLGEDFRPGVLRNVVGDSESAVGAGTFGVHPSFGDDFAVEVSEFFQEPNIL